MYTVHQCNRTIRCPAPDLLRATQLADAYEDWQRIPAHVTDEHGRVVYDSAVNRESFLIVHRTI